MSCVTINYYSSLYTVYRAVFNCIKASVVDPDPYWIRIQ